MQYSNEAGIRTSLKPKYVLIAAMAVRYKIQTPKIIMATEVATEATPEAAANLSLLAIMCNHTRPRQSPCCVLLIFQAILWYSCMK